MCVVIKVNGRKCLDANCKQTLCSTGILRLIYYFRPESLARFPCLLPRSVLLAQLSVTKRLLILVCCNLQRARTVGYLC